MQLIYKYTMKMYFISEKREKQSFTKDGVTSKLTASKAGPAWSGTIIMCEVVTQIRDKLSFARSSLLVPQLFTLTIYLNKYIKKNVTLNTY